MAENIVQGLFGINPMQVQQQQNQQATNYAASLAQMDPFQAAKFSIGQGAGQIAGAVAPMLGMVNPEMQQAQQMQDIQSKIDHNTPEGLLKGAFLFNQARNPKMAFMYTKAAQEAKLAQQKESPYAKIDPKDYTPESLAKFSLSNNPADLVAREKPQYENADPLQKLQDYLQTLPANSPLRPAVENRIRLLSEWKPATNVNVAAPVTPVTIQDPQNPNNTVIVDGRTGKVIGAGPKLTQTGANDYKLAQQLPAAKLQKDITVQNLDKLDSAVSDLAKDPGLSHITGTLAGRTPNLTNTATGAQAKLDSIKADVFVSALQSMRAQNKTGGAVGNVSNREGDKLEATLGALQQAQGTSDFKIQLKKVQEQVRQSKELIQNAFDEQFRDVRMSTPQNSLADQAKAELARRSGKR